VRSRFIKTIRWRLPRHKRSKRLFGAEEDRGRWLKCWNCGFLIDTNMGLGSGDESGIRVTDIPSPSISPPINPSGSMICFFDHPFLAGVLLNEDVAEIITFVHRKAEAVAGCPFCGTTNLP